MGKGMMKSEIWKEIDGTNGMYEVSNTGKVRSLDYRQTGKTKELVCQVDNKGYKRVRMRDAEKALNTKHINAVIRGERKQANGYSFEYKRG